MLAGTWPLYIYIIYKQLCRRRCRQPLPRLRDSEMDPMIYARSLQRSILLCRISPVAIFNAWKRCESGSRLSRFPLLMHHIDYSLPGLVSLRFRQSTGVGIAFSTTIYIHIIYAHIAGLIITDDSRIRGQYFSLILFSSHCHIIKVGTASLFH